MVGGFFRTGLSGLLYTIKNDKEISYIIINFLKPYFMRPIFILVDLTIKLVEGVSHYSANKLFVLIKNM